MFTGLVQAVGEISAIQRASAGARIQLRSPFEALVHGESIAVDGVCLSVTDFRGGEFWVDASAETLTRSVLADRVAGDHVHLERALRVGDRMGGHLVTGHVDGIGSVAGMRVSGQALEVMIASPPALLPFLAPKGSVTVDGVSLTINAVSDGCFQLVLVPVTLQETRLRSMRKGQRVNLEVDVLAKYVASLTGRPGVDGKSTGGVTMDLLTRQGYL